MDNSQSNKQVTLMIIGVAILVIGLVGITYAFFNYTRTGSLNTVQVGRMNFSTTSSPAINIQNVFPINSSEINTNTDNVGSVTINVKGDTNYSNGIEYLVTAVDVNNLAGTGFDERNFPISVDVSYTANGNGKVIGTENINYFNNGVRGGNTSYYKKLSSSIVLNNNDPLLVGYIAPGETGIDGNITIKAFIDKDRIAISDTYAGEYKYILNPNLTQEIIDDCVSYMVSDGYDSVLQSGETLNAFCSGTGTYYGITLEYALTNNFPSRFANHFLETGLISSNSSNYTTDEWIGNRMVLTSNAWNSLQQNGVSFKVKIEANEGTWVQEPGKLESCPGCKFVLNDVNTMFTTWNTLNQTPTVVTSGLTDNYLDIVNGLGKKYFLGLVLNNNNEIDRVFACGMKDGTPFCVEATSDESAYTSKVAFLQGNKLWNNACTNYTYSNYSRLLCQPSSFNSVRFELHNHGCVFVHYWLEDHTPVSCSAEDNGYISCVRLRA